MKKIIHDQMINKLNKEIEALNSQMNRAAVEINNYSRMAKECRDKLDNFMSDIAGLLSLSHISSRDEDAIKREISRLVKESSTSLQVFVNREELLKKENDKLWHLIRVVIGDKASIETSEM